MTIRKTKYSILAKLNDCESVAVRKDARNKTYELAYFGTKQRFYTLNLPVQEELDLTEVLRGWLKALNSKLDINVKFLDL